MKNGKDKSPLGRDALEYIDSFLTAEEIAESDLRVSRLERSGEMRYKKYPKMTYPIVITKSITSDMFIVFVPDFEINTEGKDLDDAMYMAKDAIKLVGLCMIENGEDLPIPSTADKVREESNQETEMVYLVDVDFEEE